MALYDRNCPSCGRAISKLQTPIREAGGFPCPYCGQKLKSSIISPKLTLPITLGLAIGLCFLFGLHGGRVGLIFLLIAPPIYFVVYVIIGLLIPPRLEIVPEKGDSARRT